MVSYTEWTEIVFEVAPDSADATDVISWAAAEWNHRKEALEAASKSEARDHARSEV